MIVEIEVWRAVSGFEGFYEISNFGELRSLGRKVKTGPAGLGYRHISGKILRFSINRYGYFQRFLCRNGTRQNKMIHHLVAEAFLGPKPPGMQIHHKDFNQQNNRATNLAYVSIKENVRFSLAAGRMTGPRGELHGNSHFSNQDVIEIRRLAQEGMKTVRIAEIFGVRHQTISKIINRKLWRHL